MKSNILDLDEFTHELNMERSKLIHQIGGIAGCTAFKTRFKIDLITAIINSHYESIDGLKAIMDEL